MASVESARFAETALKLRAVHLHDNPVDLKGQGVAPAFDFGSVIKDGFQPAAEAP